LPNTEMEWGIEMKVSGKNNENFVVAAILIAVLFFVSTPANANVTASPTTVNFGNLAVGTTSAGSTVAVKNTGRQSIKIVGVSLSSTQFSYSGPTLPVTLSSDQSLSASVRFSPSAAQAYSGTLVFTRANGSMIKVPLEGAGVPTQVQALPPTITTQPASQAVTAGQTATFSVAATGTAPMTYQWKKGGTAISGATSSSYTTPAETIADNSAQITVMVTNSAGTATSNPATLTVNAGTLVLDSSSSVLNFGNVNVSASANQTLTLTNAGNSNVTISNVSVIGAGFNASGVPTGLILNPGQTETLTATFSPSGAGSATGSVSVASNASNSPDAIALSGTGVAVGNHSVALSWIASTSTVMGYNTYSSTTSGGPYSKLTAAPNAGTSYTDSTVQAALTYYYVVTAVDSAGTESVDSTQISATIP
jgi:hypothetical protein